MSLAEIKRGEFDSQYWSKHLTCYTAALGRSLCAATPHWPRALVAGGPVLTVSKQGDLYRFDHHPRPLAQRLGLELKAADLWSQTRRAWDEELSLNGRLVIAGDTFFLPWLPEHRKRHAPHWFTVIRDTGSRWYADDVLAAVTEHGRHEPRRIAVTATELEHWGRALPPGDPVHELREQSVIGSQSAQMGAAYRWLTLRGLTRSSVTAPGPSTSADADAVNALADHYAEHGHTVAAYHQMDDLWQALRQRELTVAAARRDQTILTAQGRLHWTSALEVWRQIPPLLLDARTRAENGSPDPTRLVRALRLAARFEGRHRAPDGCDPR